MNNLPQKFFFKLCLFYLMLFCEGKVQAQFLEVDTASYISWAETRPLSWKDYTYKHVKKEGFSGLAMTTVLHSVRGGMIDKKPYFEVNVLFVKEDSWTSDTTSIALFSHEKLHFDIAELYARKIRKKIAEISAAGEMEISKYQKWVKEYLKEFKRFAKRYDEETDNGMMEKEQGKWEILIAVELDRLKAYRWEGRK